MPKLSLLLYAVFAALLAAEPASLSAAEPTAELAEGRAYLQSDELQEHWQPCFKDRPADRIAATRGLGTLLELIEVAQNAVDRKTYEEKAAALYGAKISRMFDDFESVANHGCGAAQAVIAVYYMVGVGRFRADRLESLKWIMLAEKSGFAPAQEYLGKMIPSYYAEEITEARAWVDAWRPSD
jgi:hypothetical protein